jgi:hypothetical protein
VENRLSASRLITIDIDDKETAFRSSLDRKKLRKRESARDVISCAPIWPKDDPANLWSYYPQLERVEEAFKNLKRDLAIRPTSINWRRASKRTSQHVTSAQRLNALARIDEVLRNDLAVGGDTFSAVYAFHPASRDRSEQRNAHLSSGRWDEWVII